MSVWAASHSLVMLVVRSLMPQNIIDLQTSEAEPGCQSTTLGNHLNDGAKLVGSRANSAAPAAKLQYVRRTRGTYGNTDAGKDWIIPILLRGPAALQDNCTDARAGSGLLGAESVPKLPSSPPQASC